MSSSLFFQEDALGVVDDWLGGASDGDHDAGEEQRTSRAPVNIGESALVKNYKKVRNNKTPSKYANRGTTESESEDEDFDDLGGAGNKMPASRTSVVNSKKTSNNKRKLSAITDQEDVKKDTPVTSDVALPAASPVAETALVATKKTGYWQQHAANKLVQESEGDVVRKRTKTRSKQKNIRRDTRSEAVKPEHLQYASESFAGRPLTDKTIVVLEDRYNQIQKASQASLTKKGNNNKHANNNSRNNNTNKKPSGNGGHPQNHKGNLTKGKDQGKERSNDQSKKSLKEVSSLVESDLGWSVDTNKSKG